MPMPGPKMAYVTWKTQLKIMWGTLFLKNDEDFKVMLAEN